MPDDKKEAELLQQKYYGKPQELAAELSRICLSKPGVVYQAFVILDTYSTIDVALRFYAKAGDAVLYKTAVTYDGYILCKRLLEWLNTIKLKNPPPLYFDVALRETFRINLLTIILNQTIRRNDLNEPRELSQTEMDYYVEYNKTNAIFWENVNKVYIANGGKRNDFNSSVCWQLPMSGAGYIVYSQNDLHKDYSSMKHRADFKDEYGYDQIATKETIEAAIIIAREHGTMNSGKPLQYGDFSRPGGINTPDHSTHNVGMAWDMRPLRKSNAVTPLELSRKTFDHPDYDREATKNFIRMVRRLYPEATFYFNDKKIHEDIEFSKFVENKPGHWDHLHVMPFLKGRE